ncbi:MAG: type II toxin-antitoxin system RelE/ParE family toxin [bacterium]|nr:type II toxin-antitoxin system RelE/ParE family toxin [bacterium]
MKVEFLVLPNGKSPVEVFLDSLDDKTLAKVYRYLEVLENTGSLPFPHARKMKGCDGLWELRVTSPKGGVRIFYVYAEKNKTVLISGFIKKSQKTPQKEINRALELLKTAGVKL